MGEKPIQSLRAGDLVLARDETTGETEVKPVIELIREKPEQIWEVVVDTTGADGFVHHDRIGATADHPWRTAAGLWVGTAQLRHGVKLVSATGGDAVVVSVVRTERVERTYNLVVSVYHTYFVGNGELWVHNAGCAATARAAFKAVKRLANIPKSARLMGQGGKFGSRWWKFVVSKAGGGEEFRYVIESDKDVSHPGFLHYEAGEAKMNELNEVSVNQYGQPRLKNGKAKVEVQQPPKHPS